MKALLIILAMLVSTMAVIPAYAVIIDLKAEKTSYKKGDQIIIVGKTDSAHANYNIGVRVTDSNGVGVAFTQAYSDGDGNFKTFAIDTSKEKTSNKFTIKGIYNVTAFYADDPQPQKIWRYTLFDYSSDGSPVSPSAAQVMGQQSQPPSTPPTQPTVPTQPTTPTQPTQPAPTTPEPKEESVISKCGTGTIFDETSQTCIVAPAVEPEPEPVAEPIAETEETTGPKKTHIPGFPDPTKDPQSYIDRYNNEPAYKEWFDRNFPDDSIYDIVGVKGPKKTHIPGFPDPTKDPQSYIDRYNNEPAYKEWFDKNFPDDTIYDIVGVDAPTPASACGPGTHAENGVCVLDKKEGIGQCAIATAAFGTELAPQVQMLREVRDNVLFSTGTGTTFMAGFNDFYYTFSPAVADLERQSPLFKEIIKTTITPMLSTLSILNYVDIDSEQEMLGYGIGIVLLNMGLYFVAPTIIILQLRKYVKL